MKVLTDSELFTPERIARDFTPAYEPVNAALARRGAEVSRPR